MRKDTKEREEIRWLERMRKGVRRKRYRGEGS
jgi:hypothetical protein